MPLDAATHHPDGTPKRLGRYRLVRPISTGGMARVFEARRESLAGVSPRVAIKVILPDYAAQERFTDLFVNEARVGSLLQHQNLVQIQDFDCENGVYYLVMEFVEGVTVRRCISLARRNGIQIPAPVIAEIGRQVCEGLHNAHTAKRQDGAPLGLVHRDVKPSNLMVNPQGVVKVLDFGISRAFITEEREGAVRGTWGYMAPEQAVGAAVGPPADLFGLAAVIYEMVTQRALFPEKSEDTIKALLADDEAARRAARVMGQAGPLGSILVRALQRDPAARYASAHQLGRALGELLPDPVTARDGLVRFQQTIVDLSTERSSAPASSVPRPRSGRSLPSQRSAVSLNIDGPGLPVAVGGPGGPVLPVDDAPPDSLLGAAPGARPPLGRTVAAALFFVVAAGIIGFTAWQLLQPRPPAEPPPEDIIPAIAPGSPDLAPEPARDPASLSDFEEEPEPAPEPPPEPAPKPAPKPTPKAPPKRAAPAPAPAPAPAASTSARGELTISSIPRAKVIVDGRFIRESPLFRYELPAGDHVVVLITPEGQSHSFKVQVPPDGSVRRVWSFETNSFVGD
jgi:serine/threonine protein kinase